ncbi:MAG TPA: hypothetical protein DEO36_11305 [Flavobacteriaceae bacterium]|jgi:hypothetical protein|nr:hypothetical protein [Flavobacteriaceae bacterium]
MTFTEKIQTVFFWKKSVQIIIPFFIVLVIISLLFNSFSSVISFNLTEIKSQNFENGKWKIFFSTKVIISILYGVWVAHKNIN